MAADPTKKELSKNTEKMYETAIRNPKEADVDIRNPADVFKWLEDTKAFSVSTQKAYISAIQNALGGEGMKEYKDKIKQIFDVIKKQETKQLLTDRQQSQFVKWDDIMAVQKKLANMENKSDAKWRQYLIASLYTLNAPVRADYGEMEVFKSYNKKRTGNELIWKKTKPEFVFRIYKTAKGYGEVRIPLSKPLQKVVTEWFAHLGGTPKYLLGSTSSNPNTFAIYVQDLFKQHTGKDVGVSLLRHSYITHVYPNLKSLEQKQQLARVMLHSTDRQERYISLKDMKD